MTTDDELSDAVERLQESVERLERRLDAVEDELGLDVDAEAGPTPRRDEEYCEDCGAVIKRAAVICPECGARREDDGAQGSETAGTADDGAASQPAGPSTEAADQQSGAASQPAGPSAEAADEQSGAASQPADDDSEAASTPGRALELDLGVTWFGRVGALAIIIGVVFFFNYAIEQGWIGHLTRVAIGVAAGIALVAVGEYWSRREGYGFWSDTVSGLGVAVGFFAVYAAHGLPSYRAAIGTTLPVAVAAMTAVVAAGVAIALHRGSRPLASEAFFLGYVTAYVSTEFGAAAVAYVVLLAAGIGAVAYRERWPWLPVGAATGAYLVYADWTAASPMLAGGFLSAIFVVAFAETLAFADAGEADVGTPTLWLVAVNGLAFAALTVPLIREVITAPALAVGAFLGGLAVLHGGLYVAAEARGLRLASGAIGLAVVFLVGSLWQLLPPAAAVAAYALAAVVCFEWSYRIGHPAVRSASHALAAAALGAAALVAAGIGIEHGLVRFLDGERFRDSALLALGTTAVALYGVDAAASRRREVAPHLALSDVAIGRVYVGIATLVTVATVVLEAGSYLATPALAVAGLSLLVAGVRTDRRDRRVAGDGVVALMLGKLLVADATGFPTFGLDDPVAASTLPLFAVAAVALGTGYLVLRDRALPEPERLSPSAYSAATALVVVSAIAVELAGLAVSAGWALYGFALLGVGVRAEVREQRLEGIVVLALATAKVFLIDTQGLGSAARVASYITLGVILLAASFLYTRYSDRIADTL